MFTDWLAPVPQQSTECDQVQETGAIGANSRVCSRVHEEHLGSTDNNATERLQQKVNGTSVGTVRQNRGTICQGQLCKVTCRLVKNTLQILCFSWNCRNDMFEIGTFLDKNNLK